MDDCQKLWIAIFSGLFNCKCKFVVVLIGIEAREHELMRRRQTSEADDNFIQQGENRREEYRLL